MPGPLPNFSGLCIEKEMQPAHARPTGVEAVLTICGGRGRSRQSLEALWSCSHEGTATFRGRSETNTAVKSWSSQQPAGASLRFAALEIL